MSCALRGALCAVAVLVALTARSASAAPPEKVSLVLNWFAGGNHVPYYYAQKAGWYKEAGLDVGIEQGKGSAAAVQKVSEGMNEFGLSDMSTILAGRGKGADVVAVMAVDAQFPEGLYWLKSSGITGLKDLVGKKIGSPPGDAVRVIWPALARANHMDPNAITWVNIAPGSKLSAVKSGVVDAVTEFYNLHHIYVKGLGSNMGYLAWKDAGVNPYGNSVMVNGAFLRAHREEVAAFVRVTQRAFAYCLRNPQPCVDATVDANSGLRPADVATGWSEESRLTSDRVSRTVALGWMDPQRMTASYDLVKNYIGIDKPFPVTAAYTDAFLSKAVKDPIAASF